MASLLPHSSTRIQKTTLSSPWIPSQKPTNSAPCRRNPVKCNAIFTEIPDESWTHGLSQLQGIAAGLPDVERWEIVGLIGLGWLYLTARPGVLMGAIDAYMLAPLQLGIDVLLGRRNLKMSDFVVGERLGEGSFWGGVRRCDCAQEYECGGEGGEDREEIAIGWEVQGEGHLEKGICTKNAMRQPSLMDYSPQILDNLEKSELSHRIENLYTGNFHRMFSASFHANESRCSDD